VDSSAFDYVKAYPPATPVQQETGNKYFNQESVNKISQEFFVTDSTFSLSPDASTNIPTSEPETSSYYVYKKEESATAPITHAKNLFGVNLDVVGNLDKIVFEEYGDGSLRNSIAYIIPWSRGEAPIKTQTPPSFAEGFGRDNAIADIYQGLGADGLGLDQEDYSLPVDFNLDSFNNIGANSFPAWDVSSSQWKEEPLVSTSVFNFNDSKGKSPTNTTDLESRQKKLGSEIPVGVRQGIAAGAELLTGFVKKENQQIGKFLETGVSQIAGALDTPSGPIYVGNASGLISQGLNYATMFGFNIPGRGLTTSIKPDLQSNRSKWGGGVISEGGAAGVPPGAWQFLFNPSELALSVAPTYKETNTWGVEGDANGGQPLHWTNNKNPELKFNKVLLNGYVFGRQVESLEQGLIELFMKNPSGNSSHGPQVLEFVWGQRSFGPCVIKDIQINEKMWDNGLLVNADVSFTLVKVPEWSINDGQVSVYDSSTIDPLVTPEATPNNTPPSEPDSKEKPATGEPPSKTPSQPTKQQIAKKCINLKNTNSNLKQIQSTSNFLGLYRGDAKQAKERLMKYKLMYDLAQLNKIQDINLTISKGSKTQLGFDVGNFSPETIERGANEAWKKAAGSNPLTDANYPDEYVNNAIGTGIGFLRGSINNQVNSSTCTNAIAQTSQNG
jgi:hypothetical protein